MNPSGGGETFAKSKKSSLLGGVPIPTTVNLIGTLGTPSLT